MDIQAIFDSQFSGQPSEAVWIIDSLSNQIWFEGVKESLAPNSALFFVERYESVEIALCFIVWGIIEHFPEWQKISVLGLTPPILVPNELLDEGHWETLQEGLVLHRIRTTASPA